MSEFLSHIVVREAAPDDAPVWEVLRGELWPDGKEDHRPEIASFFAGTLAEPDAVLLAELTGMIVGFAELAIREDVAGFEGKRVGYVEGLYVRPEVRQRGIAMTLLRACRSWAGQQRCEAFVSDRAGRTVIDRSFRGRNCDE
jgi:aminoglycoside 6'-N-acetyltransferase I